MRRPSVINTKEQTATLDLERYIDLLETELRLAHLEWQGVDNWEFYDDALMDYDPEAFKREMREEFNGS